MKHNLIWLSMSLFCHKHRWHQLLSDAIAPFFAAGHPEIKNKILEFNYLSGENIRLLILVEENQASTISRYADNYFKNYFSKCKLPTRPVKLPVKGVFMPFPMNTIQYGLYKKNHSDQHEYLASAGVSQIMLAALTSNIDEELLITFAFYLRIGLFKSLYAQSACVPDLTELFVFFKSDYDDGFFSESITDDDMMEQITSDVLETEVFEGELIWMNDWMAHCKLFLDNVGNEAGRNVLIKKFCVTVTHCIDKCLGLNANSSDLLSDLMIKSLHNYFILNK